MEGLCKVQVPAIADSGSEGRASSLKATDSEVLTACVELEVGLEQRARRIAHAADWEQLVVQAVGKDQGHRGGNSSQGLQAPAELLQVLGHLCQAVWGLSQVVADQLSEGLLLQQSIDIQIPTHLHAGSLGRTHAGEACHTEGCEWAALVKHKARDLVTHLRARVGHSHDFVVICAKALAPAIAVLFQPAAKTSTDLRLVAVDVHLPEASLPTKGSVHGIVAAQRLDVGPGPNASSRLLHATCKNVQGGAAVVGAALAGEVHGERFGTLDADFLRPAVALCWVGVLRGLHHLTVQEVLRLQQLLLDLFHSFQPGFLGTHGWGLQRALPQLVPLILEGGSENDLLALLVRPPHPLQDLVTVLCADASLGHASREGICWNPTHAGNAHQPAVARRLKVANLPRSLRHEVLGRLLLADAPVFSLRVEEQGVVAVIVLVHWHAVPCSSPGVGAISTAGAIDADRPRALALLHVLILAVSNQSLHVLLEVQLPVNLDLFVYADVI
mmetsp:Transcript_43574/g.78687  ORF Transcript_43574/g.78687 Transcript_43574/m.78687 type:complete len:500 (-) Transcript_43574:2117-3616(-)